MTVACSTQGISSSCLRRSFRGTKKMLRPMSSPKTGSISARLTSVRPVASDFAAPAMRKRASRSRIGLERRPAVSKPPRTTSAPRPRKTRPTVLAGRHQEPGWCRLRIGRRADRRRRGPAISSGMPGSTRPVRGTPCCTRRKRGSGGASSSHAKGGLWYCLVYSRLSKVVRIARFHYSPGAGGFFHKGVEGTRAVTGGEQGTGGRDQGKGNGFI